MDLPKYAKLEHERRFLVFEPPDLAGAPCRLVEDVYFDCGRLRLRRITPFDGARPELKLCKKYDTADPFSGPIVNIYLTEAEHAALATLPGRPISKRRYTLAHAGGAFGVNLFEGALAGLVLVEAEAASAEEIRALTFPPWAALEVTGDPFFTGGDLARIGAAELAARLAQLRAGHLA